MTITRLNDGFGYGAAIGISAVDREALPGNDDLATLVDTTIEHSTGLLVAIDNDKNGQPLDDDGCGDGRGVDDAVGSVYGTGGRVYQRSLHRAKVMGGGATMAAAARIGNGEAAEEDLGATFLGACLAMQERGIGYGGHTDTQGSDVKSGCGAIDRSVEILQTIAAKRDDITNTIRSLGIDTDQLTAKDGVLDNFAADAVQETYNGRQVSDSLVTAGRSAVFKRLAGDHMETRILLNTVPGHTVNQALIRMATSGRAQVFAVDVWRLRSLADRLYDTDTRRERAFLAMLAYTLGTAAVLTKGDLPVYLIAPTE